MTQKHLFHHHHHLFSIEWQLPRRPDCVAMVVHYDDTRCARCARRLNSSLSWGWEEKLNGYHDEKTALISPVFCPFVVVVSVIKAVVREHWTSGTVHWLQRFNCSLDGRNAVGGVVVMGIAGVEVKQKVNWVTFRLVELTDAFLYALGLFMYFFGSWSQACSPLLLPLDIKSHTLLRTTGELKCHSKNLNWGGCRVLMKFLMETKGPLRFYCRRFPFVEVLQ